MKSEPVYLSQTARVNAAWQQAAEASGIPAPVLREIFLDRFCVLGGGDFRRCVTTGKFERDYLLGKDSLEVWQQRADAAEAKRNEDPRESDDDKDSLDRVLYGLKKIVEVGDSWECDETQTFLSGGEYLTKGKRYRILELADKSFGDFTAVVRTNFPAPDNRTWISSYGFRRLFRKGKLIWDWKAAWIVDWNETNPGNLYPCAPEDLALFKQLKWPVPAQPISSP